LQQNPGFRFALHDVTKFIEVEGSVDAVLHLPHPQARSSTLSGPFKP
jgi:hypothetical protein